MQYRPVLTKADGSRRYRAGEFGNASPSWDRFEEFYFRTTRDQRRGDYLNPNGPRYHLRNGRVAGGETHYNQMWIAAVDLWRNKANPADWYVSEQVPPEVEQTLLLQGEVMETERGLYLYSSTIAKPMRTALAERAESAWGLTAVLCLRDALCVNSYEWLMELLQRYGSHVIEFSAFRRQWGSILGYNTVFWEVRAY